MVFIISFLLATVMVICGRNFLRKKAWIAYLISAAVSIVIVIFVWTGRNQHLSGKPLTFANVFLQGGLAGALFIYVMFAGAVPNKSLLRKTVMPIRGQLSIIASILTLGHNIAYGRTYFVYLFTMASSLRINVLLAAICSLIMILIMLPLFVTSFMRIRTRMKPMAWKKLQRLAYVFYVLMFIHVLLLNSTGAREGKPGAVLNIGLYSVIFMTYASLRISRALTKHGLEGWTGVVQLICFGLLAGIMLFMFVPALQNVYYGNHPSVSGGVVEEIAEPVSEYGWKEAPETWNDGKYTGAAIGYNGRLTVSVTVEDHTISKLKVKGSVDDEPYLTNASEGVFEQMLEGNTTYVDAVSSATTTSDALIEAVRDALDKASESENE